MDWIGAFLLWIGTFIAIKYKSWVAFLVMLIGNIFYLVYWIKAGEVATILLVTTFIGQDIYGIWKWYKGSKNDV